MPSVSRSQSECQQASGERLSEPDLKNSPKSLPFLAQLSHCRFSMLSSAERKFLLELCDKFQNSVEDVTLAHLLDSLSSTILDSGSEEFKEWSKYMEQLNQVWVLINKENEPAEWPIVSPSLNVPFLISHLKIYYGSLLLICLPVASCRRRVPRRLSTL
jgi:hypothetical protein